MGNGDKEGQPQSLEQAGTQTEGRSLSEICIVH